MHIAITDFGNQYAIAVGHHIMNLKKRYATLATGYFQFCI